MAKKFNKNKVISSKVDEIKNKAKNAKVKVSKFSTRILLTLINMLIVSSLLLTSVAMFNITTISSSIMKDLFEQKLQSDGYLFRRYIEREYGELDFVDGVIVDSDSNSIHYKYSVVDQIKEEVGDMATIFVREDDEFKRVVTNILGRDGQRQVDTLLAAGKAKDAMMNGEEYVGEANILGQNCLVRYVPLTNSYGDVFGILFVGVPMSQLQAQIRKQMTIALIVMVSLLLAVIVVGVLIARRLSNRLTRPIIKVKGQLAEVTKGNLTVKFANETNDEIGQLTDSIGETVETLKNLNKKIYGAINILNKNLHTLFVSSTSVKDSANNQAVTVEETQRNFENMNVMIETIAQESDKANGYTAQALSKANVGMESMGKLEGEMGKIVVSSQEITNTLGVIREIAEQTNLLSLNASIESARAGEAGKGFNIVAGEIRKLAEKSTNASNKIEELVINNNKIIQEGVHYSKETTNILQEIASSSDQIANLVSTISQEIQKVKISSQEVLTAMGNVSDIALANLNDSEKVSNAMDDFVAQTLELQKFVGQFDIRSDKVKENQTHVEDVLKAKLIEVSRILGEYGAHFLPTGNDVQIGGHVIQELQIGETIVTGNSDLCDKIAEKTNTSVTIFQPTEDSIIRVATTVRNFDDTRAVGTTIGKDSKVYQAVIQKKEYFGRAFVVNKWFVAVYKPILDETGYLLGVLYLGLPEDETEEESEQN
ncbi:MAG: Cache 3/Cache 2 fusion domain-containing protein [Spirochaetales bacterium]|nr:Cache 3/Cache 2 fusion domain-containing protein [Spirochaetales bacterium]